eukprot:6212542-Pleurochrysis_carterae.AAC.2
MPAGRKLAHCALQRRAIARVPGTRTCARNANVLRCPALSPSPIVEQKDTPDRILCIQNVRYVRDKRVRIKSHQLFEARRTRYCE